MPRHSFDVRPLVFATLLAPSLGCSPIVGYPCEQGYVACHGECVAVATDPDNCGGCGHVCGSHLCAAGVCMAEGDAQMGDASVAPDAYVSMAEAGPGPDGGVDAGVDGGVDGGFDAFVADGGSASDPDAAMAPDSGSDPDAGTTPDVDGGADPDAGPEGDAGTALCDVGELACGGTCVAAGSDPQNCGACGVQCPGDTSCSGGVCVIACGASELRCDRGCIDPTNDPNHCGGCDVQCDTGICVESTCVSGYAGHIVVIGHDYTEARAAEELLLRHALTLGAARTPRVLRYEGRSALTAVVGLDVTLARLGVVPTLVTDDAEVPLRLASADVFLVDAQHDAPDTMLDAIGTSWSRALDTFLGRGGVVVALDALGSAENAGAARWMSAADLVVPADGADAFGEVLRVVDPSDGLVIGVPLSFRASAASVQWLSPSLPVVVAGASGGVVLHRTVLPR